MVGVSLKFFFHAFLYNRNICHFEFFFHGASGNFLYIIGEANVGVEGQGFTQDFVMTNHGKRKILQLPARAGKDLIL
jgi:hypothetical protein